MLEPLPESATAERSTSYGIDWEMRADPRSVEELVTASVLCSQRLLQYNLGHGHHGSHHGTSGQGASAWLRTRHGRTTSAYVTGFLGNDRVESEGVADGTTFADRWLRSVEAVAERRRARGLA